MNKRELQDRMMCEEIEKITKEELETITNPLQQEVVITGTMKCMELIKKLPIQDKTIIARIMHRYFATAEGLLK